MVGSEQSLFIGEQGKEKSQRFLGVAAAEGPTRDVAAPKGVLALDDTIAALVELDANGLCLQWRNHLGGTLPPICRVGCS